MTNEQIDALIAEKVMGLDVVDGGQCIDTHDYGSSGNDGPLRPTPQYSTDPAASKQVREKLAERFACVQVEIWTQDGKRIHLARVFPETFYAAADTEEMAVALCALKTAEPPEPAC